MISEKKNDETTKLQDSMESEVTSVNLTQPQLQEVIQQPDEHLDQQSEQLKSEFAISSTSSQSDLNLNENITKECDLNSLRRIWEHDEGWNLRKQFIEAFKDKFDFARVLCLSQVLVNIELLGTTYHEEVMSLMEQLTSDWDVVLKFRDERQRKEEMKTTELKKALNKRSFDDVNATGNSSHQNNDMNKRFRTNMQHPDNIFPVRQTGRPQHDYHGQRNEHRGGYNQNYKNDNRNSRGRRSGPIASYESVPNRR